MIRQIRILFAVGLTAAAMTACQTDGSAAPAPGPGRTPVAEGGMCGGIAGFQCQEGLYCQMSPEMQHIADGSGICRPKPQACTAASAGVSVAKPGACAG